MSTSHAVVLGGSIAGLRVLPGLTADLVGRGALPIDLQRDCVWRMGGGLFPRVTSGLDGLAVSRPRWRATCGNARRCCPTSRSWTGTRRSGCSPQARLGSSPVRGSSRPTGPSDRLPPTSWSTRPAGATAARPGCASWATRPRRRKRVDAGAVYVARTYRRTPGQFDLAGAFYGASPESPYGANLIAVDGDRWMVLLFGIGPDHEPPTDPDAFLDLARALPGPQIHAVLSASEPLTAPRRLRLPAGVRRRYDRMARRPDGVLAIGDAQCALNPAYGQGMSVAAVEAEVLRDSLAAGLDRVPERYFRAAAKEIAAPWDMATGSDLRFPHVAGARPPKVRFFNAYVGRVMAAAGRDASVARKVAEIRAVSELLTFMTQVGELPEMA
jgi:hypothetical protein